MGSAMDSVTGLPSWSFQRLLAATRSPKTLSWDTELSTGVTSHPTVTGNTHPEDASPPCVAALQSVIKVIYEEQPDPLQQQWSWGGVDLCCPPYNNPTPNNTALRPDPTVNVTPQNPGETPLSSVHMHLNRDEWRALLRTNSTKQQRAHTD